MKIISTNIGNEKIIDWNGKIIRTGIFKNPTDCPIYLDFNGVKDDNVSDLKVHGGKEKACYTYSFNNYAFWKEKYPEINFDWGFFGENLTITDLDESIIHIGDIFQIGQAKIQATQPRQPCYKLSIKFNDKKVVKKFIDSGFSGIYFKILEPGFVSKNDNMTLIESYDNNFTIKEIFDMLYYKDTPNYLLIQACKNKALAKSCKKDLIKRIKS